MDPIVIIDVETTGSDPVKDRIIQLAAIKCIQSLERIDAALNLLVNPGVPISPAATAIHGITDNQVAGQPKFGLIAPNVHKFLSGCVIAGYNIIDFDVPLLSEEFARVGIAWPSPDTRFIDAFKIFKGKERRDLAAAYMFYCGGELEGAHDASVDVRATGAVLLGQMSYYDDLATIDQAASFCKDPNALDLAGKIVRNEAGVPVYSFGKDKGKSVVENPGFGRWMLGQSFTSDTKRVVQSLIG